MSFNNAQEMGKPLTIKDEGVALATSVGSIDFAGAGVTGSALGAAVTETIPGGGGSTGFQLPLSGGLTGTNTWTTAPNVLVIDGKPVQKVQSDGTVMWTGTTTTVLTNAPLPTFDIFASA